MSWKTESLDHLFNPKTIAVIGASKREDSLGGMTLQSLKEFEGEVFPVNPKYDEINRMRCFSSVTEINKPIDLALLAVGAPNVLPAMEDCAEAGVKGAIVFSAGFKELGDHGAIAQERMKEIADSAHIAVIGPNCLGAGNYNINLNATFFPHPVPLHGGKVSIASQSGGVTGLLNYCAHDSRLGIAKFVSVGNRVNIDFQDIIRYFRQDEETEIICLFVEGTEHAREMFEEIRLTTATKPVLVYKVGRTPIAKAAAQSHTGSLAGNAELYSAAFRQAKALETDSVIEMIDTAKILATCKHLPKGNRVAVITHTLGVALIAAQTLEENGICLKTPSADIAQKIQDSLAMPVKVPIFNPIDLLAQGWANPQIFADAFELAMEKDDYDAAVIVFSPNFQENIGGGLPAERIVEIQKRLMKPTVAILSAPTLRMPPETDVLESGGIPVFTSPKRAAQALANVIKLVEQCK